MPGTAGAQVLTTGFEIAVDPPFRLDLTVWALRRRPGNRVDRWDGTTYRRAMRAGGALVDVAAVQVGTPESPRLAITLTSDAPIDREAARDETAEALRSRLGLDVDLASFYRRTADDPDLQPLIERFRGVKPPRFPSLFESLCNAVACQQLTLTVGIELLNRLSAALGPRSPGDGSGAHAFPEPGDIVRVGPDALRDLGFSGRKSLALVDLADRLERGTAGVDDLQHLGDDEASTALQALRGIGRWSAEYVLLRGLGRLQVFPGDDVGARNNLARRLGIATPLDYDGVRRITGRWAPYSGLAYFHFLLAGIEESGWLTTRAT
jgi:DNA-3-methyladenine glycosylase II